MIRRAVMGLVVLAYLVGRVNYLMMIKPYPVESYNEVKAVTCETVNDYVAYRYFMAPKIVPDCTPYW